MSVSRMTFSRYGESFQVISLDDLLALGKEAWETKGDQILFARAENSGCEGCYCEVARWNQANRRFERFAFEKFFGGEDGLEPEGSYETALRVATRINEASGTRAVGLIHSMPTFVCTQHKATV